MAYEKRLCVLKQVKRGFSADGKTLSGAVHAERMGEDMTLTVRMLDIAPVREGRYAVAVWVAGRIFCHDLTPKNAFRISGVPTLKDGFSALICFIKGDAEPVAYGACGSAPVDYTPLLKAFGDREKNKKRTAPIPVPLSPNQIPGIPSPQVPLAPTVPLPETDPEEEEYREENAYNDEAIANADYYHGQQNQSHEDADAALSGAAQKGAAQNRDDAVKDEKVIHPFRLSRGTTYYNQIREKLDCVFEKYPRDVRLKSIFPQSDWVLAEKMLIGIVYEEGRPRFLCVAVESTGEPPKEILEECVFVPRSHYTRDEGFYVVFQDADTGETVKTYRA